jgi:DNA (cytosine-5)-methyltransferase 1
MKSKEPTLSVIDFFCGAGGFSEGFRQEGFAIIAGIDNWEPAIDTFNYNFGLECAPRDILIFERSTKEIEALPDTDVIIGSPPCVSFSTSNKSGKADKSLGLKLTKIFLRIVAIKKYKTNSILKAWFMENVTNSKFHLPKKYSFEKLGLKKWAQDQGVNPKEIAIDLENHRTTINSADFGVPQNRIRVFSGEIIHGKDGLTPKRTYKAPNEDGDLPNYITLSNILEQLPKPNSKKSDEPIHDPLYPEIIIKMAELTDQFYDTGLYACEWKGSMYLKMNHPYMGAMAFPEREDRPSRTITATKIGTSREAIILTSERDRKGDGEYRTPTVREAATLMGFPFTFQFLGSEGVKWRLVGNAVCPPVSRTFARAVRHEYQMGEVSQLTLITKPGSLENIPNLNTFIAKRFDDPPKRFKGSRFRRHPFKYGNLTVSLSNYDIEANGENLGKWHTSIQYGTGEGFPVQHFPDGYFTILEPIILQFERGSEFITYINNGFSKKIADSNLLQKMYEAQHSEEGFVEPGELVELVGKIIDGFEMSEPDFRQNGTKLFKKDPIPKKQIMALYAINKICSIANGEKR